MRVRGREQDPSGFLGIAKIFQDEHAAAAESDDEDEKDDVYGFL